MKRFTPLIPNLNALHPVRAIAAGLNLLVRQQPWAAERLARHAGKTLRVSLGAFSVTLTIDADGHLEQSDSAVVPDVVLDIIAEKLSLSPFFDPAVRMDIAEYVHISGQAALAQVISDLARDLRPEPEDALAHWIGDVPARRVGQGVQSVMQGARKMAEGLAGNISEYLSEETDVLTGRSVMTMHAQQQQQVHARAEALSQRYARLVARLDALMRKSGRAV